MPLTPCERAVMIATVGGEAVLASDLLAMAEENIGRNIRDQFQKQSKKLIEAGRESDVETLRQQLDIEKKKWMTELRTAINESVESSGSAARLSPEQLSRRKMLEGMLKHQVEMKLAYYDARRKIPADNMPAVEKQLGRAFEELQVKKLLKEHGVESWRDLDLELRKIGSSLEQEKRVFFERNLAQQWMQQQVKPDDEVSFEQMLNYYRENPTEFDKPANTRWQLLNVSFARHPSRQEAYATLAEMGNKIMGGADFAEVAKQGSDGAAGSDGRIRDWPDDSLQLPPVVKQAVEGLPGGQMSPILEDWRGYYIVRVVERTPAHRQSFEVAQSDIREKIKQRRNNEQLEKYISDMRRQVPIWTVLDTETASRAPTGLNY